MSLGELVAQTAQALKDARDLYGPAPASTGWSSTGGLSTGREGLAAAGDEAAGGWQGGAAETYGSTNSGQQGELGSAVTADADTGPPIVEAGAAAAEGRAAMNGVIEDTQAGVAAIAPSTGTAAGQQALVTHLQGQLGHAKALLTTSRQRHAELASMISRGSSGYGARMPLGGGGGSGMTAPAMPTGLGGFQMPSLGGLGHHHHGKHMASFATSNSQLNGAPDGHGLMGFGAAEGKPTIGPPDENMLRKWVEEHFGIKNTFGTGSWENAAHDYDGGWHHPGGARLGYGFDFHGTPQQMSSLANWIADHWSGQTLELIHDGPGFDPSRLIKNAQFTPSAYGHGPGSVLAQHTDHVHWALTAPPYSV